jgi:hypothetical protein
VYSCSTSCTFSRMVTNPGSVTLKNLYRQILILKKIKKAIKWKINLIRPITNLIFIQCYQKRKPTSSETIPLKHNSKSNILNPIHILSSLCNLLYLFYIFVISKFIHFLSVGRATFLINYSFWIKTTVATNRILVWN